MSQKTLFLAVVPFFQRLIHYALFVAGGLCLATACFLLQTSPGSLLAQPHVRGIIGADPETSCGPVSLAVISEMLNHPVSIEEFNELCQVGPHGITSMLDMRRALVHKGFNVQAFQFRAGDSVTASSPMVLHLLPDHFAVAVPVDPHRFILVNPPKDPIVRHWSDVTAIWDGAALIVSVNP